MAIIKWAKEWNADAFIAQWDHEGTNLLSELDIPIILQNYKSRSALFSNLTGDYIATGRMAAQFFAKKKYKNFAFYGFDNIVWSRERAEGFEDSVKKHGEKVHFFSPKKIASRELWFYKPSALSKWLTKLPKPIAIMACDDERAQNIT